MNLICLQNEPHKCCQTKDSSLLEKINKFSRVQIDDGGSGGVVVSVQKSE